MIIIFKIRSLPVRRLFVGCEYPPSYLKLLTKRQTSGDIFTGILHNENTVLRALTVVTVTTYNIHRLATYPTLICL